MIYPVKRPRFALFGSGYIDPCGALDFFRTLTGSVSPESMFVHVRVKISKGLRNCKTQYIVCSHLVATVYGKKRTWRLFGTLWIPQRLATANPMPARRGMMTTPQIHSFFPKLSLAILLSGFRDLRSPLFPASSQSWRPREGVPAGGVTP